MTIIFTLNILFIFMNHPMSMGMVLIMQTIAVALTAGSLIKMFWTSYVLVITMLSGMLVLFIYMASIASNEKFKNSISLWFIITILMVVSLISLLLSEKMIIKNNYLGVEMSDMFMMYLNKLFNMENMSITIMMVTYLLLTMIVASYLVNISEGPMRLKI